LTLASHLMLNVHTEAGLEPLTVGERALIAAKADSLGLRWADEKIIRGCKHDVGKLRRMTMEKSRKRPAGIVVGSMVAITFGTVFVLVNSAGLPAPWPLIIRTGGLVVAALLIVGLVLVVREAPPATRAPASGYMNRRYWLIVALEAGALFGGLAVVNGVLHRTAVSVAWVALVVGVHFFGLAWIWHMPLYHWLGAAMTVLGLAGFLIYALGGTAAIVGLVAGVGSGAALYATVGAALRDALRGRASVAP
jgi:hypothetical protein